jgi:phage tail tape-measure protein
MLMIDDLPTLQRLVNQLASETQMAKGALSELKRQLKEKFSCDSYKEGLDLLEDMKDKRIQLLKKSTEKLRRFKEEHKETIRSLDNVPPGFFEEDDEQET